MELKHLRTFLCLSEIKNFTKTAERLHYAQSYVTTQIRQLEEELNVRLFERLGKTTVLTRAGFDLLPYARRVLHTCGEMESHFKSPQKGRITIGAAESLCLGRLPSIIMAFQKQHPDVELYLKVLDIADFTSPLLDNSIDLAFILDRPIRNPSFAAALQLDEPIAVFAPPGYPLAQKQAVSIADFHSMPFVLTGKDCCYRKQFESMLAQADVTPKIVLETGSIQVLKQMAVSGLGVCVLPVSAVSQELQNGQLVQIHCTLPFDIQSQLILHKDKWHSEYLEAFLHCTGSLYAQSTAAKPDNR